MRCIEISRKILLTVMVPSPCGFTSFVDCTSFTSSIHTSLHGIGSKLPHVKMVRRADTEWEMLWTLPSCRKQQLCNLCNGVLVHTAHLFWSRNFQKVICILMMWELCMSVVYHVSTDTKNITRKWWMIEREWSPSDEKNTIIKYSIIKEYCQSSIIYY